MTHMVNLSEYLRLRDSEISVHNKARYKTLMIYLFNVDTGSNATSYVGISYFVLPVSTVWKLNRL